MRAWADTVEHRKNLFDQKPVGGRPDSPSLGRAGGIVACARVAVAGHDRSRVRLRSVYGSLSYTHTRTSTHTQNTHTVTH